MHSGRYCYTHMLSLDMQEGLLRQTCTEQGVVVQRGTEQGVAVQRGTEQGVAVQRGRVPEGRTWDTGTRGQYIVQSGRGKVLVEAHTYIEGEPDLNIEDFGPCIA